MNGCAMFPDEEYSWATCRTEGPHGSCDVWPPCKDNGMWRTATYTLAPEEKGDSLSVSLYDVRPSPLKCSVSLCSVHHRRNWLAGQVMEPGNTRERFDATVEGAITAAAAGEFNQSPLHLDVSHFIRHHLDGSFLVCMQGRKAPDR